MLEPLTLKILFAIFGFLWGSLFPATLIYCFWFLKRNGIAIKSLLKLSIRLLWFGTIAIFITSSFAYLLLKVAGGPVDGDVDHIAEFLSLNEFGVPGALGLASGTYGGIIVFVITSIRVFIKRRKKSTL